LFTFTVNHVNNEFCLRYAVSGMFKPNQGSPLFPGAKNFTLIDQYRLVPGTGTDQTVTC